MLLIMVEAPTSPSALTRVTSLATAKSERPLKTTTKPTRALALHLFLPLVTELPHQHINNRTTPAVDGPYNEANAL